MAEVKEDNVRERMSKIKHKILVMSGIGGGWMLTFMDLTL